MNPVQFPAQLSNLSTLKDGSIKVTVETQELSGKDAADLFAYRNMLGYVTFTPRASEKVEVPVEAPTDNTKSPSQRLRAVLYLLWEKSDKKFDIFDTYYTHQMEKIIDQLKEKLD